MRASHKESLQRKIMSFLSECSYVITWNSTQLLVFQYRRFVWTVCFSVFVSHIVTSWLRLVASRSLSHAYSVETRLDIVSLLLPGRNTKKIFVFKHLLLKMLLLIIREIWGVRGDEPRLEDGSSICLQNITIRTIMHDWNTEYLCFRLFYLTTVSQLHMLYSVIL
jgi:hypothetical protein